MAVDNAQPPGNPQQSSTVQSVHVVDRQTRARARTAIGLDPDRETAPETFMRPPDDTSNPAQWLLVACIALLAVAVLLLLLAQMFGSNSSLSGLFGTRLRVETGVVPQAAGAEPAQSPFLASLPGYQLWVSDEFLVASELAEERSGAGQVAAAVVAEAGVYRMQALPRQLGWTLFDLAGTGSYHLETSATVAASSPAGASGVIARFAGPGNFYLLSVDGAGVVSVQLWLDSEAYTLQSNAAILRPAGQENRLAVEDDGARVRFYANQVLVAEVVEPQLPFERPGIAVVAAGEEGAIVDYDWIAIYRPQR